MRAWAWTSMWVCMRAPQHAHVLLSLALSLGQRTSSSNPPVSSLLSRVWTASHPHAPKIHGPHWVDISFSGVPRGPILCTGSHPTHACSVEPLALFHLSSAPCPGLSLALLVQLASQAHKEAFLLTALVGWPTAHCLL